MRIAFKSLIAVAVAAILTASANADIIQAVSVTGNITGDAGSSIANLNNDSGLSSNVHTGDALATAQGITHVLNGNGHQQSWTNNTTSGNPEFVFDLGSDKDFGTLLLWNYGNNAGSWNNCGNHTRDFSVIFHTAAEGNNFANETAEFNGTMDFVTQAEHNAGQQDSQTFQFSSVNARYVALRIDTNWGGQTNPYDANLTIGGGDRYGLGEVRFATEAAAVPEPTSLGMFGLGVLGLVARRRRRS